VNDLVQNKVVEQKDILKIIEIINNFYKEKNEIFDKTQAEIDAEEKAYYEWSSKKYASNDIANYPEFEYKTHYNKLSHQSFTFSFYCIDGLSYEDKSFAEAQIIMASGYSSFEKITINLDMTWRKIYNAKEYGYNEKNNVNLSVYITFYEDDIYIKYNSKNADADMKYLKSEITDVFEKLDTKYSSLISKRESIKYNSTLSYAYILSAVILTIATFVLKTINITINFDWWQLLMFIPTALIINMFIPSTKLNSLYKLILPKKKTIYDGREVKKVDNVKEFKSSSEVHIGKNAFKAGKREQIEAIKKKSKSANLISLIISIIIVFVICILF